LPLKHHQAYAAVTPYVTKDGSVIRELMHPAVQGNQKQSLAEARVPAGQRTLLHRHRVTEELYYITHGQGLMRLGDAEFNVAAGDTICIPPGHRALHHGNGRFGAGAALLLLAGLRP
jgi:mannose-6-phosphate isomerase-like protein (cupin superfamily)